MPHVQITLLEGRTPEQKRKVAEGITRVLVEEAGARREAVSIAFPRCPRHRLCPRRRPGGRPETRSLAALVPPRKNRGI